MPVLRVQYANLNRDAHRTILSVGGLLFLLGIAIAQQMDGGFAFLYSTIAGTLVVVLLILYRISRLNKRITPVSIIESQLQVLSRSEAEDSPPSNALSPILENGGVGSGWNRLLSWLENQQLEGQIERRLQSGKNVARSGHFARAFRSLPDGVAVSDRHGSIISTNPAWSVFIQHQSSEGDPSDQSIQGLVQKQEFTNWEEISDLITSGTKPIKVTLHKGHTVADGVLQLSRFPLEGRRNEPPGFVWTIRDVTQHELAKESHEQFLASATHELRTPLTNIRAYTESLLQLDDIPVSQQREFFNVIHAESLRLGRLLNQLLDLQQLEAGSMTLSVSAFDVLRMVEEVREQIQPLVRDAGHELICKFVPGLKTIEADKEKLTSSLINLVGNAIKYTPSGGEIRLVAEQLTDWVSISVEDNGIGIAAEELPKIFERFYRCQDDRVAQSEGNGLGLTFAYEVVRLHHGDLSVESELNKGSRFTIKIPVRSAGT